MENCLTDVYLHTFICSHPRAPKLLAVHIHGTELGLPRGTLIWKTCLWTRLWTYLSPQMKHTHSLGPFLSWSVLCTLPWYCRAFTSLSEHYICLWSNLHCQQRTTKNRRSVSRWNEDNDASPVHYQPWAYGNWLSPPHLKTRASYRYQRKPAYLYILYLVVNPWRCLSTKDK